MSTALATLAGKLAERVGMDSVDPQELITTSRQTAFKGDASDAQFIAGFANSTPSQFGLNPSTKEIYALPDERNGIVPVVGIDGWSASSTKTSSFQTAWTLNRTTNPAHAGFTAKTAIIRSALPSGWMMPPRTIQNPRRQRNHRTVAVASRTDVTA